MNISANQLRAGVIVQYENNLWQCLEAIHKTPGNLRAFVQAKLRNVNTGSQKDFRFSSTEMLEKVELREHPAQFLYADGDHYHFMDSENFEQFILGREMLGDAAGYLLSNASVQITFYEEKPLSVKLPRSLAFTVTEADPGMKSATATSSYKMAKIETGLTIKVPQFIEAGERVVIDTETGTYLERAKD